MVAEYSAGHLTRSLVRIPNSRVDRTATAVMIDLSKVSPLAAAVPVSLSIPPGLQHQSSSYVPVKGKGHAAAPTASEPPPSPIGIHAALATASGSSPRASASCGQAAAATAPSRKRTTTKKPNTVARNGKRARPGVPQQVNTPIKKARVVQKLPGQASVGTSLPNHRTPQVPATSVRNTRSQPPSAGPPLVMVTAHNYLREPTLVMNPHQLLQERDQLRHENLTLKQQLLLFHMLFRNKEKLKSVVRTLGIPVR